MKTREKEKPGRSHFIMMFFAFSFGMILSNLIQQGSAEQDPVKFEPLFIYKGIDKTLDDVPAEIKTELEALANKRRELIELAVLEQHLHQYAHDKDLNLNAAGEELFGLTEVSEAQINTFYSENQALIDQPLHQVKGAITEHIRVQQLKQGKQAVLSALKTKGDLMIPKQ